MLQQFGFQIKRAVLGLSPADCILRALTATSLDCAVIELSHRTLDDTGQFISYSSSHICMPLHYHLISNTATRVLRASPLDNYNRKLEINRVAGAVQLRPVLYARQQTNANNSFLSVGLSVTRWRCVEMAAYIISNFVFTAF